MTFEKIYRDYFFDVYKYLRGLTGNEILAEELAQETFFKAMKSLDDFRGDYEVRVWLYKIAKNAWFIYCKKANRHVELGNLDDKLLLSITKYFSFYSFVFSVHDT